MNNTSTPLNTMTPQGDAAFNAVSALVSQVWNGLDQWLISDLRPGFNRIYSLGEQNAMLCGGDDGFLLSAIAAIEERRTLLNEQGHTPYSQSDGLLTLLNNIVFAAHRTSQDTVVISTLTDMPKILLDTLRQVSGFALSQVSPKDEWYPVACSAQIIHDEHTALSQDVGLYGLTGGQRVTNVLHDALLMITTQHRSPVRTLSNIASAAIDFAFTLSVQSVNKPLIQWLESVNLNSPYDNAQLGYPSEVEKYIKRPVEDVFVFMEMNDDQRAKLRAVYKDNHGYR
jgi:hypothetical protein